MNPHDERVVALFGKKDKRERLLFLASSAARRSDFIDALLHDTRSLDRSQLTALEARDAEIAGVLLLLRGAATGPAYCISAMREIDGREVALAEALRTCVGRAQDTLVFCLANESAYYENHEGEQFVLAKR
jgi:hypothetical protein